VVAAFVVYNVFLLHVDGEGVDGVGRGVWGVVDGPSVVLTQPVDGVVPTEQTFPS